MLNFVNSACFNVCEKKTNPRHRVEERCRGFLSVETRCSTSRAIVYPILRFLQYPFRIHCRAGLVGIITKVSQDDVENKLRG